jgi:hypothetical protein
MIVYFAFSPSPCAFLLILMNCYSVIHFTEGLDVFFSFAK